MAKRLSDNWTKVGTSWQTPWQNWTVNNPEARIPKSNKKQQKHHNKKYNKEPEVEIEDEGSDDEEEETGEGDGSSEDLSGDSSSEETVQTSQEIEIQEEHVDEVKQIVEKNPRITLWSSRSSAVFRYLRKTEPEFSISKEASVLIEEAVAKKYHEIWALFEDL